MNLKINYRIWDVSLWIRLNFGSLHFQIAMPTLVKIQCFFFHIVPGKSSSNVTFFSHILPGKSSLSVPVSRNPVSNNTKIFTFWAGYPNALYFRKRCVSVIFAHCSFCYWAIKGEITNNSFWFPWKVYTIFRGNKISFSLPHKQAGYVLKQSELCRKGINRFRYKRLLFLKIFF